ncbi:MAG: D-arabinono-1,4-lactone oxidase [Pseudomonadales bacterium]|nr:D-arabinono-1,4-lactone oxidase [Pseudomonadales bacterium]
MSAGWENWSGSVRCPGAEVAVPADVDALVATVRAAAGERCLRAVGSGHSFVPFWQPGDRLVSLEKLRGLQSLDGDVAVLGAGTPIHAIGPLLAQQGRALPNQGDIDRQALAGAVATGTHGTGRGLGSLSSAVERLELVDGRGELRCIDGGEVLDAARVSFGLFGVSTAIGMRTVRLYGLHERNWLETTEETLAAFEARADAHRHHEFWWLPNSDACIAKTLDAIDVPAAPRLDEIPFGAEGERWGAAWQVFPSARELRFNEMEYAVPAERGLDCFRALRAALRAAFPKLPWPVEYRIVAADEGWLSPTAGVEVAAISVHQDARRDARPLFDVAEPIFRAHGGRPHWGKCQFLDREMLRALYPRLGEFHALRADFDPQDLFLGAWLEALLGRT